MDFLKRMIMSGLTYSFSLISFGASRTLKHRGAFRNKHAHLPFNVCTQLLLFLCASSSYIHTYTLRVCKTRHILHLKM